MAGSNPPTDSAPSACPVDHNARASWLSQSKSQSPSSTTSPNATTTITTPTSTSISTSSIRQSCSSSTPSPALPPTTSNSLPSHALGTGRQISSIPRANPASGGSSPLPGPGPAVAAAAAAANREQETGASASGHWVYPSERMFFDALRRKQMDARPEDMRSVVPIHNAVNERAWREILGWERRWGGDKCGGPRLLSFSGLSTKLTPKARWNTLLGYQAPFDRHDWVVDRCGTKVEYVIDFYSGKDEGRMGKPLNFYLDVRPKLNTWEGWKMRIGRVFGLC